MSSMHMEHCKLASLIWFADFGFWIIGGAGAVSVSTRSIISAVVCPSLRRFASGCSHSSSSSSSSVPSGGRLVPAEAPTCGRRVTRDFAGTDADGGEELLVDAEAARGLLEGLVAGIVLMGMEGNSVVVVVLAASDFMVGCARVSTGCKGLLPLLLLLLPPVVVRQLGCELRGGGLLGWFDTNLSIRNESRTDMDVSLGSRGPGSSASFTFPSDGGRTGPRG